MKQNPKDERRAIEENLEQELNIAENLKEIIDDSDDEFPLWFNDHNELMEIFTTFEETNLREIQMSQTTE